MNISSLIKVFGIAAAGFVPQAQANPFGISFVKVDPPKDKKEQAICFRLKLSQTDVFSEHNFTDITFRPDTTVFLQKNTVIDDEEESLKKTFKNFNCEKDPFEIPDKYLPLEDKQCAEWVDKDGKPLKFLAVHLYDDYLTEACLVLQGEPKESVFSVGSSRVAFLDHVRCVVCEDDVAAGFLLMAGSARFNGMTKRGLSLEKQRIDVVIFKSALRDDLDCEEHKRAKVLFHTLGNIFQGYHVPTSGYFECDFNTRLSTQLFCFCGSNRHICGSSNSISVKISDKAFHGSLIAILRCAKAMKNYYAPRLAWEFVEKEKKVTAVEIPFEGICETGDDALFLAVAGNLEGLNERLFIKGGLTEAGDKAKAWSHNGCKKCLDLGCFFFFFPEDQPKK